MSAKVKVMRLVGAGMVTLAVVPWLGISPAVADKANGKSTGSAAAAQQKSDRDDRAEAKAKGKSEAKAEAKSEAKANSEAKAQGKSEAKSKAKGKSDKAAKKDAKGQQGPANKAAVREGKAQAKANGDPGGNNGTLKIHRDEPEPSPERKNQPKVCTFHLHGFNFDGGSSGTYRIEAHKWGGASVKSGTWTADSSGEWRTEVMTLPDGHYKAYAKQTSPMTPGGEKKKVFKIRCGEETTSPTGSPSPTETETETETSSPSPTETETETETSTPSNTATTSTSSATVTVTETVTETVTPTGPTGGATVTETVTETVPGSTTTVTVSGGATVTVTQSGSTETVTVTNTGGTVTNTGGTVTNTATATNTGGGGGGTSTPGGTVTVTETVTVGPNGEVLPTQIGNEENQGGAVVLGEGDTAVLGTKTGVLAATGLDLPMGAALGISFALLLAGGALMIVPSRLAVERSRRH